MDRRHHLRVRALTFVGVGVLAVLALWSAGLPPTAWLEHAQALIDKLGKSDQEQNAAAPIAAGPTPSIVAPSPASAPTEALGGTDSSVSVTPLPLHLVSTSPGRNAREGTAMLGVDIKNPQTYGAGAILANGARLAQIHADYVVLDREGKSVRLYRAGAEGASNKPSHDLLMVGGAQPAPEPVITTREVLTDYLRPSPAYDGDFLHGFVVYPGSRSGVFSQLGLQSGDVITSLNDTPFSDTTQAYALFRQLTDGIAMVATVKRKDKTERITLDGAHILADQERAKNAAMTPPPMMAGPP